MKKLVLATMVALSTATHAISIEEVMNNRSLALTTLGVVDYYNQNCFGLTSRGQRLVRNVYKRHAFNRMHPMALIDTKEYQNGNTVSKEYGCFKLRNELRKAGAGKLFK